LENVKFPSISNRVKNLLWAGHPGIQGKLASMQLFEWREDDLLVSTEAINDGSWCNNWAATRRHLDHALSLISYYELKEATSTIELAMWKARIEEVGAVTLDQRSSCRVDVPGPAKDAILQYLKHGEDLLDNAEEGGDTRGYYSQDSSSSLSSSPSSSEDSDEVESSTDDDSSDV
jgi:hypothetical protein